jgi:hypothetical protein
MTQIFHGLYPVHPLFPFVYLLVLGNGLLGPAIYCAVYGIPYDLAQICARARRGHKGARYVVHSWATFAALTVLVLAVGAAR